MGYVNMQSARTIRGPNIWLCGSNAEWYAIAATRYRRNPTPRGFYSSQELSTLDTRPRPYASISQSLTHLLSEVLHDNMERTIGLLGGGQLGQMLCEAANPLGLKVVILDASGSPAKQVNAKHSHVDGSFTDASKIRELARQCDILTVEIEHVDTHVLEEIAEKGVEVVGADGKPFLRKVEVQPSWKTLRVIQDKYTQKEHLSEHGKLAGYCRIIQV